MKRTAGVALRILTLALLGVTGACATSPVPLTVVSGGAMAAASSDASDETPPRAHRVLVQHTRSMPRELVTPLIKPCPAPIAAGLASHNLP